MWCFMTPPPRRIIPVFSANFAQLLTPRISSETELKSVGEKQTNRQDQEPVRALRTNESKSYLQLIHQWEQVNKLGSYSSSTSSKYSNTNKWIIFINCLISYWFVVDFLSKSFDHSTGSPSYSFFFLFVNHSVKNRIDPVLKFTVVVIRDDQVSNSVHSSLSEIEIRNNKSKNPHLKSRPE